jgi:succinyl-diaminopimelate desuccinylase
MWATLGDSGPLFAFTGHTDVVPPGPLKDWKSHPFNPVERDGFLYGRGAADMKSSLAAMVVAAERFLSSHTLNFQLGFLITSDEEGEAINGIRKAMEIFKQREILIDYCLVGEPSSSRTIGDTIKIGRRGSLSGKLKIIGVEGHVAYPELASNPIHGAINSLRSLVAEHWDDGNSSFPPTSFQISNIHAGFGANNVIPESLEVDFNFRYSTEIDDASIKERVHKILDQDKQDYEIQWHLSGKPFLTNQSELIDLVSDSVKEETGETPIKSTAGGTSDGRFIAPTGAQVVELGPSNQTIHKINECIEIADLEKLTRIYEKILTKLNAALR